MELVCTIISNMTLIARHCQPIGTWHIVCPSRDAKYDNLLWSDNAKRQLEEKYIGISQYRVNFWYSSQNTSSFSSHLFYVAAYIMTTNNYTVRWIELSMVSGICPMLSW